MSEQMAARIPHADHPPDRGLGRRRFGEDDRDHGPRQPARRAGRDAASSTCVPRTWRTVPVVGSRARVGRRAGGGASRGQPLFGDGEGHLGGVRRRPAGGGTARRAAVEAGTGRVGNPDRGGAVDDAVDTEDEAFAARAGSCPTCHAPCTNCRRGSPSWDDPDRRDEKPDRCRPARAASRPTTCAGSSRRWSTTDSSSKWAAVRPLDHHRLRAARRLAGGADGGRSAVSRRRLDGGRLPEDHPLRRHGARRSICPSSIWCDCPGFQVGLAGGKTAMIRWGVRALAAINQTTMPWCSDHRAQLLRRRRRGHQPAAGCRCAMPGRRRSWGSLPLEGGIEAAYRAEIDAAPRSGGEARRNRGAAERVALARSAPPRRSGWRSIIDPRETRRLLCDFAELARAAAHAGPGPLIRRCGPRFGMRPWAWRGARPDRHCPAGRGTGRAPRRCCVGRLARPGGRRYCPAALPDPPENHARVPGGLAKDRRLAV